MNVKLQGVSLSVRQRNERTLHLHNKSEKRLCCAVELRVKFHDVSCVFGRAFASFEGTK